VSEAIRLTISDVWRETSDAVTIAFDDPAGLVGGISGQHVVIHADIDGVAHRRVFSLSSSPELGQSPAITVKRLHGGAVSPFLVDHVVVGDVLDVEPAAGVFGVDIDESQNRTYFGFIAGSGSVPILSVVRTILSNEPRSNVHLAYGNRTESDIIFRAEFDELIARFPDRLTLTHMMSGTGNRIDHRFVNDWLMEHPPASWDVRYLVSGPPGLIDTVVNRLASLGVMDEHVLVEHYLPPTRTDAPDPFDGARVTVVGGGGVTVPAGESILNALARVGEPVQWACQSGVCGTCKAQLISGEVDPGFPFVLTDEERADGVILTCVSRPLSEDVVVRLLG
jgi:ring-1,2-phenylacetyl-CoA epoxidase subunit PaaE